jgi:hypothetical protein
LPALIKPQRSIEAFIAGQVAKLLRAMTR